MHTLSCATVALVASFAAAKAEAPTDPPLAGDLACASTAEFFPLIADFVQMICCTQEGETCPVGSQFPTTCASAACARTIGRVGMACEPWLSQPKQGYLSTERAALAAAVQMCTNTPAAPDTVKLSNQSVPTLASACGATLIDGREETGAGWDDQVTLQAQPGFAGVALNFSTLYLPLKDLINIYDGDTMRHHAVAPDHHHTWLDAAGTGDHLRHRAGAARADGARGRQHGRGGGLQPARGVRLLQLNGVWRARQMRQR